MIRMGNKFINIFIVFFVLFISFNIVYAIDNAEKEDISSDVNNVVEQYNSDILDEEDEDLFADFDKIVEEDLNALFDEISTSEDVEESEMTPELFEDEIADDTIVEKTLLEEEDEIDLMKN